MEGYENNSETAKYALRQSWGIHRQVFGPIANPVFGDHQQVRLLVINTRNHISRREVKRVMKILKEIKQYCICNEDKAACIF